MDWLLLAASVATGGLIGSLVVAVLASETFERGFRAGELHAQVMSRLPEPVEPLIGIVRAESPVPLRGASSVESKARKPAAKRKVVSDASNVSNPRRSRSTSGLAAAGRRGAVQ